VKHCGFDLSFFTYSLQFFSCRLKRQISSEVTAAAEVASKVNADVILEAKHLALNFKIMKKTYPS